MTDARTVKSDHDSPRAGPRRGVATRARRPGAWVRGEARRRELAFVRRRWWVLGFVGLSIAVLTIPSVLLTEGSARGFVVGISAASYVWLCVLLVMQVTGTASTRMGDLAERWTADELTRGFDRNWTFVHDVAFVAHGNVDHVAVGPAGVYAIETKYRSRTWRVAPKPGRQVRDAANQAYLHAEQLSEMLATSCDPVRVTPVLVWWCPEPSVGRSGDHQQIGRVHVLPGSRLATWSAEQTGDRLTAHHTAAIVAALDAHIDQDATQMLEHPDTWLAMLAPFAITPVVALFGLLANLDAWTLTQSWPAYLAFTAGFAAIGVVARRWNRLRYPALGWLTGIASGIAVVVLATIAA
ncbi:MAG: nuclease-related domain-containing protein [Acidimicrobiia bacterium]